MLYGATSFRLLRMLRLAHASDVIHALHGGARGDASSSSRDKSVEIDPLSLQLANFLVLQTNKLIKSLG